MLQLLQLLLLFFAFFGILDRRFHSGFELLGKFVLVIALLPFLPSAGCRHQLQGQLDS